LVSLRLVWLGLVPSLVCLFICLFWSAFGACVARPTVPRSTATATAAYTAVLQCCCCAGSLIDTAATSSAAAAINNSRRVSLSPLFSGDIAGVASRDKQHKLQLPLPATAATSATAAQTAATSAAAAASTSQW